MANIVIDPVIVMMPPTTATRAEVEIWLKNLTVWLTEALTAPFTWLHDQEATYLLEANRQFPSFEQLRQLQSKYHLDINVSHIAKKVNAFFRDDMLDIANHLQNLAYNVEPEAATITIEPGHFISRLPTYLYAGLQMLLASCCACKHIEHPFGQGLSIATLALEHGLRKIVVSFVVLDALPDFARPADNKIAQTFPLLITPDDLQSLIDIIDVWTQGERGIVYAIKQQSQRDQSGTSAVPFSFRLGPRFIESVNKHGLDTNETLLKSFMRAASAVIMDQAKDGAGYRLHPFRSSEAADSPQLIRDSDQARAWRLILQLRRAGWRLHYWQIPTPEGCIIKFANVGRESEREIY